MFASNRCRLLAATAFCTAAAGAVADMRTCRVQALQGEAELIGSTQRSPLATGTSLPANSRLGTGKGAWVDVSCSDQTRVTVGAETEIDIGTLVGERGPSSSVAVRLYAGVARFFAPVRSWADFRVRGPAAVASVRQTEWIVEAPRDATNVFVVKGRVAVDAGAGGSLELTAGDGIDVVATATAMAQTPGFGKGDAPDGKLGERKTWSAERVERTMQRLGAR